jgi:segregation and condensation protein A
MEYLFAMKELDLEIASEFLVMAATLLHIKSKMLLPEKKEKTEEEADPREELVLKLMNTKSSRNFQESSNQEKNSGKKYTINYPKL